MLELSTGSGSKAILEEITKMEMTFELLGMDLPTIENKPERQSQSEENHIVQSDEKVSELILERDKLQRMLTRHDSAELRQKVEELNDIISRDLIHQVSQTDEIREYYSHVLGEKFTLNKTQGIVVFESGIKYTEEEITGLLRLGGGGPGAIKITHQLKSKFNAVLKGFKPIYEEAV